jgi:hypothetical protein
VGKFYLNEDVRIALGPHEHGVREPGLQAGSLHHFRPKLPELNLVRILNLWFCGGPKVDKIRLEVDKIGPEVNKNSLEMEELVRKTLGYTARRLELGNPEVDENKVCR